ncbi:MAG TPA: gluconokinase, GntK/IdnK-type [Polyangiaceae bacterium]|nr:gluconokinase, GntK/IdnK-type [Polyangiaceae bacterium]
MLILVMGVTGAGKSTVGRALAARLGLPFYDADDFHPLENRQKMAANIPLDDADRRPWLELLAKKACGWERAGGAVLACSALKQAYRDLLFAKVGELRIVFLEITREHVSARLERRKGQHAIIRDYDRVLAGQFGDLEPPAAAFRVSALLEPVEIVERIVRHLGREGIVPRGALRVAEEDAHGLSPERVDAALERFVAGLGGPRRVLLIPPDITRKRTGAGGLTATLFRALSATAEVDLLPALGTHRPMTEAQLREMFPGVPPARVLPHDPRRGVLPVGEVPASFVRHVSDERLDFAIPCGLSRPLLEGGYDRIVSIGEVVPHEVVGMAGHAKNLFIGVGGKDAIDRTHFLGAVVGLEQVLGRIATPVRDVLAYMATAFAAMLPVTYVQTVGGATPSRARSTRGLFAGDDEACFRAAAELSRRTNVHVLEAPLAKVVVHLDPSTYTSMWVANKAIYRTRLALADSAELVVLAPGVTRFGEDPELDRLIRRHGYRGTQHTLAALEAEPELRNALAAAAHLIHGSPEGRFRVLYAAGGLEPEAVRAVGYEPLDAESALRRYDPSRLERGLNVLPDGERLYFIDDPATELWATAERLSAGTPGQRF